MSEPIQSIAQNNYILQAPPPSSTMSTTALEYDAYNKISGYAGSAFAGGVPSATSGYWQDASDVVNSSSGAWGGSALPISAGPGVKLEMNNGTLVVKSDETVLYDRQGQYDAHISSFNVSEPLSSFEKVLFFDSKGGILEKHFPSTDTSTQYLRFAHYSPTLLWSSIWKVNENNYTEITGNTGSLTNCLNGVVTGTPTEAGPGSPYNRWVIPMKVIGINRK